MIQRLSLRAKEPFSCSGSDCERCLAGATVSSRRPGRACGKPPQAPAGPAGHRLAVLLLPLISDLHRSLDLLQWPLLGVQSTLVAHWLTRGSPACTETRNCPQRLCHSMVTVPLDVQLVVVDWVYRSSQNFAVDYHTLRSCALVCRAWTAPAQRLLFRRVPRGGDEANYFDHAADRLLDTLRNAPRLASHVRFIYVAFEAWDTVSRERDLALLELCPHLDGISIFVNDPRDAFDSTLETRLRAAQLQPVALELDAEITMVEWIVHMWPSIRALNVRVLDEYVDLPQPLPEIHIPDTIQSMTIHEDHQIRYFSWRANSPLLQELSLDGPFESRAWPYICQQLHDSGVLPHLQTLRIGGKFPPHQVLMHLPRLENLLFSKLPVGEAVISLPQTLIRVGYHLNRYMVCELELSLVQSNRDLPFRFNKWSLEEQAKDAGPFCAALRTLPKLQHISATPHSSTHQLTMLNGVCRERGIEMEMYHNEDYFGGPQNVDWI
ncbi:hypothetical protein FA95DRAFT_610224 [Auriscalpium vulgare]|uniref:Uncharacterized protein n=1 Tax=Auriscalpium vulgare TaxID=40419 RepID=A0ACB8RDL5_9AGAM|nr:hypothetical protein FA95DRAFT_610224 [Auriscalpium vulgare]